MAKKSGIRESVEEVLARHNRDVARFNATLADNAPSVVVASELTIVPGPTFQARPLRVEGKRAKAHDAATCGCDSCVNARDVARGVAEPMAPLVALVPAAPKAHARKKIKIEIVTAEEQARDLAPPPVDVHADAPIAFYTWGYDGGATPGVLADIVAARKIAMIVDIRRDGVGQRVQGWRADDLRARFGAAYVRIGERPDVAKTPARVLILRKEEAPGDSSDTLALSKALAVEGCPVVHLYRNELVDGRELQRVIDLDAATGGDHEYDCEIETAGAPRAGKWVA